MNDTTIRVIIIFSILGVLLFLYGILTFKKNFLKGFMCCTAGVLCSVGINLMAMV